MIKVSSFRRLVFALLAFLKLPFLCKRKKNNTCDTVWPFFRCIQWWRPPLVQHQSHSSSDDSWLTPSKGQPEFSNANLVGLPSNRWTLIELSRPQNRTQNSSSLNPVVFALTPLWAIVIIFKGIPWHKWRRTNLIVIATIASTSLLIVSAPTLLCLFQMCLLCCCHPFRPGFHHPLLLPF